MPLEQYHRQPQLDAQEQEALAKAAAYFAGHRPTALPPDLHSQLVRLLEPLTDITTVWVSRQSIVRSTCR